MKFISKERIIQLVLLVYMVAVTLFGYVVLTSPPNAEAQCKNIYMCVNTAGGCCPGITGTGSVYTGSRYGGPHYYSEVCINPA